MRGKIKFYSTARGFGFILPDDGSTDIYFAKSSLPLDRKYDPVEGDAVEFDIRAVAKGRVAHHIVMAEVRQAAE